MTKQNDIYEKYDLLLPSKFEGGYLIIALHDKIQNEEIAEQFTITDIRNILEEITRNYGEQQTPQSERILKILLHFYIRNSAKDPGKYYLTERARKLVEFLKNILENPYKNFPLKESFEKSFTIVPDEIQSISDLERKFGRLFIEGPKKIINDHLEGLEDELVEGYAELNKILDSDEKSATTMVNQFAFVFRKFGERAEDITNSVASKDKFLKGFHLIVEQFYERLESFKHAESEDEFEQLKNDYNKAGEIYQDIEAFFKTVDDKIINIQKRIHNASEKLSELHEQFTARAQLRLQIKRMLKVLLDNASYSNKGIILNDNFPLKKMVNERGVFVYPGHHDFNMSKPNIVIRIPKDDQYIQGEYLQIIKENDRQEIINQWIQKAKLIIEEHRSINLKNLWKKS
ncbi:hypothetical protein LJC72_02910 [Bacteroides sp. OttesenSCG-928-D19]|nr:hypothetical protein [Bacteroides sp. OttesenSCG-928-N06]MDL2304274.1 hypothetical protein [Bacteroides sp. OttesenSCG-928-D19]